MSILNKIDPPVVEPDRMQSQPVNARDKAPVVTADTARQGPKGSRILLVVICGVVGAFVIMGAIWAVIASGPH